MHNGPLITESPVRVSYRRALIITMITLIVSQLITAIAILVCDIPEDILREIVGIWFALAAICSTVVAFPLALVFQRERLKLARAMQQLEEVHAELARRARLDPLTGILNREAFLTRIKRFQEQEVSGAMLMVDIDHFKQINDTYGHHAGDKALQLVANAIEQAMRDQDIVGRIGGEEFGVFVPGEKAELAGLVAERIRLAIARIDFKPEPGLRYGITASIGVAQGAYSDKVSELFRMADNRMYDAKQAGRNRVVIDAAA
ncbi:GGDEF domain-containing protein [Henriciella aquimarina]|uniref:GGDEF domain-containing protein n=1 Tax=Henriciella aquimarina TaxID=545261 RepID=UPI000A077CB2|nr:GGDEF domain-containing protein [Henriciella aquimarina]